MHPLKSQNLTSNYFSHILFTLAQSPGLKSDSEFKTRASILTDFARLYFAFRVRLGAYLPFIDVSLKEVVVRGGGALSPFTDRGSIRGKIFTQKYNFVKKANPKNINPSK